MRRKRQSPPGRRRAGDRGSVTLEMALVLPALALLAAVGVAAVVVVTHRLGCVARARDAALAAARGEEVTQPGGPGRVESIEFGNDGTVTASVKVFDSSCTSTAAVEP